jgi:hypothetical protein
LRTDAAALHLGHYIERSEIDALLENLLLNPSYVLAIERNDLGFVQPEKSSEVLLLSILIPTEQEFDNSAHRFEVEIACERDIIVGRCTKCDVHDGFQEMTMKL